MIRGKLLTILIFTVALSWIVAANAAIYGSDDRTDVRDHSDRNLQELAKSVVVLTRHTRLPAKDGFCSGAIFRHQGRSFLMTASHCIKDQNDCDEVFAVRNYQKGMSGSSHIQHRCKRVIYSSGTLKPGLAIATISDPTNKDITNDQLPALKLSIGDIAGGDPLAVIGHPEGQPKMISDNCSVTLRYDFKFRHQCDTFSGNSGSPTFNLRDYSLVGVLQGGRKDRDDKGRVIEYSTGSESSLDLSLIADEVVSLLDGERVEGFWSYGNKSFVKIAAPITTIIEKVVVVSKRSPQEVSNIRIKCLDRLDATKCNATYDLVVEMIKNDSFLSKDSLGVSNIYIGDRWYSNNYWGEIEVGASKWQILRWLKKLKNAAKK